MLTDEDCQWLEGRGPIWLGTPLHLDGSTQLDGNVRLGHTIELKDLIELVGRKLEQLEADEDWYSNNEVFNKMANRFPDSEDRLLFITAINEHFVGD